MKTTKSQKRFLSNKTVTVISLIISVLSLFISIVSTFYYTRKSNILSSKSRLINLTDRVYDLVKERNQLNPKTEKEFLLLSDLQLQTKHLLFEIDQSSYTESLTPAQNRLLAEAFEMHLYYNHAQKYWDKVFNDATLSLPEIKAEYYRCYAQFLYKKQEYENGEKAFRKSLLLQNGSEGQKYINLYTYTQWAQTEFMRESQKYYLNRSKNLEEPLPKFTKAYNILKEAKPLLNQFQDYTLYYNAVQIFKQVEKLITDFESKYTNNTTQTSVQ